MKRLIISFVLLLSVVGICIYENFYINRFCDKKAEEITVCRELYSSDKAKCEKAAEKFAKEWKEHQAALIFFVNHIPVDDITKECARLPSYAKGGTKGDFLACCSLIESALTQIKTDQRITIDSFY